MTAAGLDTSGYSFPYIAGWANGGLDVLAQTADQVTRAARHIASHLTGTDGDPPAPGRPHATLATHRSPGPPKWLAP